MSGQAPPPKPAKPTKPIGEKPEKPEAPPKPPKLDVSGRDSGTPQPSTPRSNPERAISPERTPRKDPERSPASPPGLPRTQSDLFEKVPSPGRPQVPGRSDGAGYGTLPRVKSDLYESLGTGSPRPPAPPPRPDTAERASTRGSDDQPATPSRALSPERSERYASLPRALPSPDRESHSSGYSTLPKGLPPIERDSSTSGTVPPKSPDKMSIDLERQSVDTSDDGPSSPRASHKKTAKGGGKLGRMLGASDADADTQKALEEEERKQAISKLGYELPPDLESKAGDASGLTKLSVISLLQQHEQIGKKVVVASTKAEKLMGGEKAKPANSDNEVLQVKLNFKQVMTGADDDITISAFLYNQDTKTQLTDEFLLTPSISKVGLNKSAQLDCLFADIKQAEFVADLKVVVRVFRSQSEDALQKEDGELKTMLFQRPLGCAVLSVDANMLPFLKKKANLTMRNLEAAMIYELPKSEREFLQMHQAIIAKAKLKELPRSQIQCELGIYQGSLKAASADSEVRGLTIVPRMQVAELEPGEERHIILLTLQSAELSSSKSIGLRVSIRNGEKDIQEKTLSSGLVGTAPRITSYKSTLFYGTNVPVWNERITVHLPKDLELMAGWHFFIELIQESSKDHSIAAFACLPIIQKTSQTFVKNQVHTLQCYKYNRKQKEAMEGYLNYTDTQKADRASGDKLVVETSLLSTMVCDDPDLYRLINWSSLGVKEIERCLVAAATKPASALIGVHKALLDSFLEMLVSKKIMSSQPILPDDNISTGSYDPSPTKFLVEDGVFSCLSFLLACLTSEKSTEGMLPPSEAGTSEAPPFLHQRTQSSIDLKHSSKPSTELLKRPIGVGAGTIGALADLKQAEENDRRQQEAKAKAIEQYCKALAAKWKGVIQYYLENFAATTAHRALVYYLVSMSQWVVSPYATEIKESDLTTNPRAISMTRLVDAVPYLFSLALRSANADNKKSRNKFNKQDFLKRLTVLWEALGLFMAGERTIDANSTPDPAVEAWFKTLRMSMLSSMPTVLCQAQTFLVPMGVSTTNDLCESMLGMFFKLPNETDEGVRATILSMLRVLIRDGYARAGSGWQGPVLWLCCLVIRSFFANDRDFRKRAYCVPLLSDLIRLLSGETFEAITPGLPSNWQQCLATSVPFSSEDIIKQLAMLLPDVVQLLHDVLEKPDSMLENEFLGPTQPKQEISILRETSTAFLGLIALVWTPERLAEMGDVLYPEDGPNTLASILGAFNRLILFSAYPKYWLVLRIREVDIACHVLQTSLTHVKQMAPAAPNRLEVVEKWCTLALNTLMDPVLNSENIKEDPKRECVIKYCKDHRDALSGSLLALCPKVHDLHIALLPSLMAPVMHAVLNKKPSVSEMATAVFRQFLRSEMKATSGIEATLAASMDAVGKLVRDFSKNGQLDQMEPLQKFFEDALSVFDKETLEMGKAFKVKITQLMSQLTTLERMPRLPRFEDERASAAVKLVHVWADSGKTEVLETYLEFLHELHMSLGNHVEAANVLMYHQSTLTWTNPSQIEKKAKLLADARSLYDTALMWEQSVKCCKLLNAGYLDLLMLEDSSGVCRAQASFQDQIVGKDRIFPSYYRVALYGNGFKDLKGKEFVYRSGNGNVLEGVRDFTQRMQEKFKGATIVNSSDLIPDEKLAPSDAKIVQIGTLTPSSREELENKPNRKDHLRGEVSPRLLAYYGQCETDVFTYARVHSQNKDKNANEFKELWIAKTYLITEEQMPCMMRCVPVAKRVEVLRSPIENALFNITSKNRELEDLIWKLQNGDSNEAKKTLGPLSMNLSGVIDAAVMGGVDKYRDAFFAGSYLQENPKHKDFVQQFGAAMELQLGILDKGLKLFASQCDDSLKPLCTHLQLTFQKMTASVRKDIITKPHHDKKRAVED